MRTVKDKKASGRWSKVNHEIATYEYVLDNKNVAAIFPTETRDGKIAWGYFVKRIGNAREVNKTNFTTAPIKLESHYPKKRDVKKAIESLVGVLSCQ